MNSENCFKKIYLLIFAFVAMVMHVKAANYPSAVYVDDVELTSSKPYKVNNCQATSSSSNYNFYYDSSVGTLYLRDASCNKIESFGADTEFKICVLSNSYISYQAEYEPGYRDYVYSSAIYSAGDSLTIELADGANLNVAAKWGYGGITSNGAVEIKTSGDVASLLVVSVNDCQSKKELRGICINAGDGDRNIYIKGAASIRADCTTSELYASVLRGNDLYVDTSGEITLNSSEATRGGWLLGLETPDFDNVRKAAKITLIMHYVDEYQSDYCKKGGRPYFHPFKCEETYPTMLNGYTASAIYTRKPVVQTVHVQMEAPSNGAGIIDNLKTAVINEVEEGKLRKVNLGYVNDSGLYMSMAGQKYKSNEQYKLYVLVEPTSEYCLAYPEELKVYVNDKEGIISQYINPAGTLGFVYYFPDTLDIKIAGQPVTSLNCSILKTLPGVTGTASYDPDTKTLYLEDASITELTSTGGYALHTTLDTLRINVTGDCSISSSRGTGIFANSRNVVIGGTGTLDITAGANGIVMNNTSTNTLDIDGKVTVNVTADSYGIQGREYIQRVGLTGTTKTYYRTTLKVGGEGSKLSVNGTAKCFQTLGGFTPADGYEVTAPSRTAYYGTVERLAYNTFCRSTLVIPGIGKTQATTVTLTPVAGTAVVIEKPYILGDVNGDGSVTVNDIVKITQYVLGTSHEIDTAAADVNVDGSVTVTDIVYVTYYILYGVFPSQAQAKVFAAEWDMEE